ncbi:LptA/OstA family protein [Candidatus Deianiraea vastatrix]|uniref:LptC-related LPS transport protein n=1 Tax=Candidatus Deianiraea vastatrix TaxID=2163644 RepID=A0A5B8XIZ5_9RICK|nr:LPS export ABC transporter periplasmic protein LptC [Candidatus Deianiraea vastatrix]QED23864.1 Putative LptC-related LPS transport protein [Candidatus Deianiraea vastatrix]
MPRKIEASIEQFNKKNKQYKRIIKIVLLIFIFIIAIFSLSRYKQKILGIILSAKDYSIKGKKISIFGSIDAINVSMSILNNKIDIDIKSDEANPDQENNIYLKNVYAKLRSKNNQMVFFLKSIDGIIEHENTLIFNNKVNIYDEIGSNAVFENMQCDFKTGNIKSKNPVINGVNGSYTYNIIANELNFNTKEHKAYLVNNVFLLATNNENQLETKANAKNGIMDLEKYTLTLIGNVKVLHLDYELTADKIDMDLSKNDKNNIHSNAMFSSDVKNILASGNIVLIDKKIKISSNKAEYFGESGDVFFTENAKAEENGKTLFAHSILYNIHSGKMEIKPKNNLRINRNTENDSRIKVVLD